MSDTRVSDVAVYDVTRTHSAVIPWLFPAARDMQCAPSLFAAVRQGRVAAFAVLASPLAGERSAYLLDLSGYNGGLDAPVADALIEHVVALATSLRAPALEVARPISDPDHRRHVERHGFRSVGATTAYRFCQRRALELFSAKLAELDRAGRVPGPIDCLPYDAAPHTDELSALCHAEFGLLTHGHLQALGDYPAGDLDYSCSAQFRLHGALVGAQAVGVHGRWATFDPLLIAKAFRNTWAFAYVLTQVLQRLGGVGVTEGVALIRDSNIGMRAVMARLDASAKFVQHAYQRDLSGSPGVSM